MESALSQSRPSTMRCILALSAAAVVVMVALLVRGMIVVQQDAVEQANESVVNVVGSVEHEIARTLESFDLSIKGAIIAYTHSDFPATARSAQQLMLFDHAATASYLQSVTVLGSNGDVLRDSRSEFTKPVNLADRAYFWVHRDRADVGLYLGRPHPSRFSGKEVINLSRGITGTDGSFGGVVTGAIGVEYFQTLLAPLRLGLKGTAALVFDDGTLLATAPSSPRTSPLSAPVASLVNRLKEGRAGSFKIEAQDGVVRSYTYTQIGTLPLFVLVGIAEADVTARWWPRVARLTAVMALLALLAGALAALLTRELGARQAAEIRLAQAALVDPLTGVANRRAFEHAIENLQSGVRGTVSPTSLLMIDIDRFKQFNDANGHVAGDIALSRVAGLIAGCCRRGDLVARYGGEEFVMLLPDADLGTAFDVAERVRLAVRNAEIPGVTETGHHVTVSIGAAQHDPGEAASDAVSRADAALYRAKAQGRDRTVCAGASSEASERVAMATACPAA